MSQLNSEGVAEFIRLIDELEDFTEGMSGYEKKFMYDNIDKIEKYEKYGDKIFLTETQLDLVRKLYVRFL
jgi:hypothetical protein